MPVPAMPMKMPMPKMMLEAMKSVCVEHEQHPSSDQDCCLQKRPVSPTNPPFVSPKSSDLSGDFRDLLVFAV